MLTSAPDLDNDQFHQLLQKINQNSLIWIACINDIKSPEFDIIASGTLLIEHKFIHGGKNVGHIEDIVVHNNYRSKGIAKNILHILVNKANKKDCYKVILDCKPDVRGFYEKNGFECNGNQMSKYFQ